jgi:hypothetical protein
MRINATEELVSRILRYLLLIRDKRVGCEASIAQCEQLLIIVDIPVVDERVGGGASVAECEQLLIIMVWFGLHHHRGQLHILLEPTGHLQCRQ